MIAYNISRGIYGNGGGGVFLYSDSSFDGDIIANNLSDRAGGGLMLNECDCILKNVVIFSNTGTYGGGLSLFNGHASLTNVLVSDNQATRRGGGLYIEQSSLDVLHSTIARNFGGDGSGISVMGSALMTNTILVSNSIGISVSAGSNVSMEATLWGSGAWANGIDVMGQGTVTTGTVNVYGDPDFVNPDAGDYHIGPNSAARDAGVDAGVTTDIDGQARPNEVSFDIGADEWWESLIDYVYIYLPLVRR